MWMLGTSLGPLQEQILITLVLRVISDPLFLFFETESHVAQTSIELVTSVSAFHVLGFQV